MCVDGCEKKNSEKEKQEKKRGNLHAALSQVDVDDLTHDVLLVVWGGGGFGERERRESELLFLQKDFDDLCGCVPRIFT